MRAEFFKLKAEEFRSRAERCEKLAAIFSHPVARADLEAAAKGWGELAARQNQLERETAE